MSGTMYWKKYVADGFKEDCEALLERCKQVKKLSYEKFCDVWRDMDFVCIFYGRRSGAELAELTEEVVYIAKSYMLNSTNTFEESVAGLFLVYGLINLQPFNGFAALKLIDEDVPQIQSIEQTARSQRRLDVLYILGSVLIKGPSQYHVARRERGLEYSIRKYLNDDYIEEATGRPKGVLITRNDKIDLTQELISLNERYKNLKLGINDCNLKYVKSEVPEYLKNTFQSVVFGLNPNANDAKETTSQPSSIPKRTQTLNSIKEKAMKSAIDPLRHLTGLEQRRNCTKSVTNASTSGTNSIAPNRKKKTTTPRRKRKVSKIQSESDSCDSDVSLNSDSFKVKPAKTRCSKRFEDNNNDLSLQVGSLPIIITAPEEKEFEIEIIDNKKPKMIHTDKRTGKGIRNVKMKHTARSKKKKIVEELFSSNAKANTTENSTRVDKSKMIGDTENKEVNRVNDVGDSSVKYDRCANNYGVRSTKKNDRSRNCNGDSMSGNGDDSENKNSNSIIENNGSNEQLGNIIIRKVFKKDKRDMKKNRVVSSFHRLGLSDIVDCEKGKDT